MRGKQSGLGKGLDAIFIENDTEEKSNTLTLRISEIEPNRSQPRAEFNDEALAELADSIAHHGVLQPLLVRPIVGGGYQIVAGERRWRACRMAGVSEVPVIIRDLTDSEVMEIALIENLQREDLTPIEEARGYQTLIETYNFTQDEVSKTVGKSRPTITNALRLLTLPESILDMINRGDISAGHARALLSFKNAEEMQKVAKLISEQQISVRELEKIAKKSNSKAENVKAKRVKRGSYFEEVEIALKNHLSRKVKILQKGNKNKGFLQIEFYNEEDLEGLARLLGGDDE